MATTKTEYIVIGSTIKAGRPGEVEICTRVSEMEISDKELLEIKVIQKKAAEEIEELLKKTPAKAGVDEKED